MRSLDVYINLCGGSSVKDGIKLTNVSFSWPDGRPIPLSFSNLCAIGLKTLFKKREIVNGPIKITIKDVYNLDDPVLKIGKIRGRRFYMVTEDNKAFFWLCNGVKTDLNFHVSNEEEAVLNWLEPPLEGQKKWFDLIAY
jgi:hypothetical protein